MQKKKKKERNKKTVAEPKSRVAILREASLRAAGAAGYSHPQHNNPLPPPSPRRVRLIGSDVLESLVGTDLFGGVVSCNLTLRTRPGLASPATLTRRIEPNASACFFFALKGCFARSPEARRWKLSE
ncbi:hypothetical protein MRX96_007526 [Rhipicephalus microplus]